MLLSRAKGKEKWTCSSGSISGIPRWWRLVHGLVETDLGKYLIFISDKRKNSEGLNRLHSLFRNLLKKSARNNLAKAERIRKNNRGRKKLRARYIRDIGVIKTIVNRELNLLFTRKAKPIKEIVVEDLSTRKEVRFEKKRNRRLSGWLRGYLQEWIRYRDCAENMTFIPSSFFKRSWLLHCSSLCERRWIAVLFLIQW